jgi:uncharacterized membrane protein YbaN (DUF454 family)/copper chaperone CopZ
MGSDRTDTHPESLTCPVRSIVKSPRRLVLACIGLTSTGLGALGAILPGLPTTIFIIIAAWCFAKSCPWLEEALLRNRVFAPAMAIIDGTRHFSDPMRLFAGMAMWTFGLTGTVILLRRADSGLITPSIIVGALVVGSFFIALYKRGTSLATETSITIGGMSCGKCVNHVRHLLSEVAGLKTKQVSIGQAIVIHDTAAPLEAAVNAVRAAGFEARVENAA